ncbi:MAG: hypothetical protein MZV64_23015 [Ignavibacteriales bacterium]|nr:hypothetical protein [Ignavibacteriales bacterium]
MRQRRGGLGHAWCARSKTTSTSPRRFDRRHRAGRAARFPQTRRHRSEQTAADLALRNGLTVIAPGFGDQVTFEQRALDVSMQFEHVPASAMRCRPSTFWVMRVKWGARLSRFPPGRNARRWGARP